VPGDFVDNYLLACLSLTPKSAAEKAALFAPLASHLLKRLTEQKDKAVSVRESKGVPSSVIAAATMEMIDALNGDLGFLFSLREILVLLLNIKSYSAKQSRRPNSRKTAIYILALNPETGSNQVARTVGVDRGVVSRWKREDETFSRDLQQAKESIADPRHREMMEKALKYMLLTDDEILADLLKK